MSTIFLRSLFGLDDLENHYNLIMKMNQNEVSKNFFSSNLGKSNLNILKCSMMSSYVKIYTRKGE